MADPELKWWHVRWGLFGRGAKKIGLWLAIVFAVCWTLYVVTIYVLGFFQPWFAIRNLGKDPNAWLVPKAPRDQSLAQLSGATIEEYGYSIHTPWAQPSIFKGRLDTLTNVTFHKDNVGIVFFNPAEQDDLLTNLRADPNTRKLFSEQAVRSSYGMMAAAMNATPKDAKWWKGPRGNAGLLALMVNKTVGMLDYHDIYKIGSGGIRGFQLGDPEKPPYHVRLDLFNGADQRIQIQISAGNNQGPVLTQAQLNAMVASIRPVGQK